MLFGRQERGRSGEVQDQERLRALVEEEVLQRLTEERRKWEAENALAAHVSMLEEQDAAAPTLPEEEGVNPGEHAAAAEGMDQELLEQADEVRRWWPEFNLEAEMQDPLFALLAASGYPLGQVVAFVYPDQAKERAKSEAEQEVLQRIRSRNLRPASMGYANVGGSVGIDIASLTDEEIGAIDRRVRRGERVVF
ncbi:MAG: hypothetical protein ACOYI4_00875 [Christensenellales bacterium]|jgi:hypothetical protein